MSSAPWCLTRWIPAAVVLVAAAASPAVAQVTVQPQPAPPIVSPLPEKPIPWVVLDARGAYPSLGLDKITVTSLGVAEADLPGRALSLTVGVHVYPVRRARLKLGLGAEMLMGSGSSQKKDAAGVATGPVVHRRLSGLSGQASLNFGRGKGWSYVTAGAGPFAFDSYLNTAEPDSTRNITLNFGGGARWFSWEHVAFTVDLRFYRTGAADATAATAARGAKRLILFSAGISVK